MRNVDAPNPPDSICPDHGTEGTNIYQGGMHRNYWCGVEDCDFQVYRHPCPICDSYEGGLAEDGRSTTPCPSCTAKRTPCQQAAGIHHVPCEHFNAKGHPITAVTMPYTNHNGVRRDRTFKPMEVRYGSTKWHPESQWLLTVWDVEKQAVRSYALFGFSPPASEQPEALILVPRRELEYLYRRVGDDMVDEHREHIEAMLEKYGEGLSGTTIVRPGTLRSLLTYAANFGGVGPNEARRCEGVLNDQLQAFDG